MTLAASDMVIWFSFFFGLITIASGDGLSEGIVTKYFESGDKNSKPRMGWTGEPEMLHYKHYVECDYIHEYMYGAMRKFRFELHCLSFGEVNGAPDYTVFIDYDYNVLDRFNVISCNAEDVVNSIFPPRQRDDYPDTDDDDLPDTHHLRYRASDGKCWDRKYSFVNRISTMAERHDPEKIPCPSEKDEWFNPNKGSFAHFGNCRVPKVPVPHNVIDWHTKEKPLDWFPDLKNDDGSKKYKRLLECDWDRVTYEFKLLCVQMETLELLAFVSRSGKPLERFTVKSCKEEDLVNSIFVNRFTTANKGSEYGAQHLYFAAVKDEKCYDRVYGNTPTDPEVKDCPKYDDEWVNPTSGFAGMFGHCKVPQNKEETKETKTETKDLRLAEKPGLVTKAFPSGSKTEGELMGWTGEPEMLEYKHYLECDSFHLYKYGWSFRRFRFEMNCLSFGMVNGAPDYTVFIDYDYNVLDRFNVTSCNHEDVINSIFIPHQRYDYPEKDGRGLPNTHHIRYITTDRKCYERKYEFRNRASVMAKRLDAEQIPCPSDINEWIDPSNGWFERFKNCRVPIVPVPHIVVDWVTKDNPMNWYIGNKDQDTIYTILLQCDWDRLSSVWRIQCVKVKGEKYYRAFVKNEDRTKDRFTVTSCKEEDLVNSIFPTRITTAHPHGPESLRFAAIQKDDKGNELCYQRVYPHTTRFDDVKIIPCPQYDDDWVNPTQGFAGMFGNCEVMGTEPPNWGGSDHKTSKHQDSGNQKTGSDGTGHDQSGQSQPQDKNQEPSGTGKEEVPLVNSQQPTKPEMTEKEQKTQSDAKKEEENQLDQTNDKEEPLVQQH